MGVVVAAVIDHRPPPHTSVPSTGRLTVTMSWLHLVPLVGRSPKDHFHALHGIMHISKPMPSLKTMMELLGVTENSVA